MRACKQCYVFTVKLKGVISIWLISSIKNKAVLRKWTKPVFKVLCGNGDDSGHHSSGLRCGVEMYPCFMAFISYNYRKC